MPTIGVSFDRRNQKWLASMRLKGKTVLWSYHATEAAAALCRREAEERILGYARADRTILIEGDLALVPLVGRMGNLQGYAKIDASDVGLVNDREWYALGTKTPSGPRSVYARCGRGGVTVLMHKLILPGDHQVDHISGDGLDNRRANLRPCTAAENSRNKRLAWTSVTGFKGVSRHYGRFQASIRKLDQTVHIGTFDTAEEAARARDAIAVQMFGEFAKLNFPQHINP